MYINNFNYSPTEEFISWIANNVEYKISLKKIIEAMVINNNSIILVKQGDNFVESRITYLASDSKVIFSCNLEGNTIEFDHMSLKLKTNNKIFSATINTYCNVILICTKKLDRYFLQGFGYDGKEIFVKALPNGYEFGYFTKSQNLSAIICDVCEEEADPYDRCRFKFLVDIKTGDIYNKTLSY